MYRFDTVEDFENTFDAAYAKALEEEYEFSDFDAVALLAIRGQISYHIGVLNGLMDAVQAMGHTDYSIENSADEARGILEIYIEACTRRMEELGLL